MRARIRTIKPELAQDAELWDLGAETGLPVLQAFEMIWCYADREGRFEWKPRELKPLCVPYWDGDFSRVLEALESRRFLVRYTSGGRNYGVVRNFSKHQHINGREPASTLPKPPIAEENQDVARLSDPPVTCEPHVADVVQSRPVRDDPDPFPIPSRSLPDPKGGAGGVAAAGSRQKPEPPPDEPWRNRAPGSLDESLRWPLGPRAKSCLQFDGQWACCNQWPEVVSIHEELAQALGRSPGRLSADPRRDSGVRAVLGLYADGVTHDELLEAVRRTARDEWWHQGRKGLSSLTPEVVRRLLEGAAQADEPESAADFLKREAARRKAGV